ncbi:hypothetical protein BX600DRAFT_473753 [Xylariales sp. PMI_506]|nr:hypothetical protein BX600DRAFT_473753 [Xylariales sp. PMI_506]
MHPYIHNPRRCHQIAKGSQLDSGRARITRCAAQSASLISSPSCNVGRKSRRLQRAGTEHVRADNSFRDIAPLPKARLRPLVLCRA